jgi:hypothetical protein
MQYDYLTVPSVEKRKSKLMPNMTPEEHHPKPTDSEQLELPCLNDGKPVKVGADSNEAKGIFNVFCNGECEDQYAQKQ